MVHHSNLSHELHESYVKSLLTGGSVVRMKHHGMVRFEGAGFGDWAKSMWGKAKSFFTHRIKPVLMDEGKKLLPLVVDASKQIVSNAINSGLDHDGNIKERVRASLQRANSDASLHKTRLKEGVLERLRELNRR